jgi:NAD-dependent DNA ligase
MEKSKIKLKQLPFINSNEKDKEEMPIERKNEEFVKILGKIEILKMKKGEFMSAKRYKDAQEAILKLDTIGSVKDLEGVKYIGKRMIEILTEYETTGKVEYLEKEKLNPVNIFSNIYGVGHINAQKLVDNGIKTIEQLRENQDEYLNEKQKIGLKYYEDILERIPRKEIDLYNKEFYRAFDAVKSKTSSYEIVGSYRRGAKDSGDIDVIITDKKNKVEVFKQFIKKLEDNKIILHRLTDGKSKVLVIGKLGDYPARRVDFLYTSPTEYPFAVLYFTGSKEFNTAMRQRALDVGYSLNEHGIHYMKDGVKGKKVDILFEQEEDIFEFLNMEYKSPEERIDGRSVVIKSDSPPNEQHFKIKKKLDTEVKAPKGVKVFKIKKRRTLKKKVSEEKTYEQHITLFRKHGIEHLKSLEVKELEEILLESNRRYYNEVKSTKIFSDEEYDIIKEYLEKIDKGNKIVAEVGAPIKKDKVQLPYQMPSMDKIKPDTKELGKWLDEYKDPNKYVLSCKLDGVSGLYEYKDSPKLYTRGNGIYGQDVSHLLKFLKLPKRKGAVVRGEFIISKANFASQYRDKNANARNLVSGIINKKSPTMEDVKYLDFVMYEVIEPVMKPSEQMNYLKTFNFNTVRNHTESVITNELLSKYLVDWRESYDYEMDGIIVIHDKIYERDSGNPKHAFAFKMILSDQIAEAKVLDVLWTPSKDGYLKPRIRIEPIELVGVTIEYATAFNGNFVEENKIGVGAIVKLIRSGDVIPHIMEVVTPAVVTKMPDVDYVWTDTHIDIKLLDIEANPVVKEKKITLFFKDLDIAGVGPGNVRRLIAANYDTIPKILAMTKADYLIVEGFKEKLADKIHKNIKEKLEEASLIQLMKASNIFGRGLGEKKIKPILDEYPDILTRKETQEEKVQKVKSVKGIAEKSALLFVKNIDKFLKFMDESNLNGKLMVNQKVVEYDKGHPLFGKKIILTEIKGKELERFIESKGGEVGKSMSKKVFLLVKKDENTNTEKSNAADLLGIRSMTEAEFRKTYIF